MPLLENEQRCIDFINGKLEDPITGADISGYKVAFRSWKSCFDVYDIDLYHRIAQALEIRELSRFGGGIHYLFNVPVKDSIPDHWSANLSGDRDTEFLEKYGDNYELVDN